MCCTRLAANTGRKKIRQKSPSGHYLTTLSACIFAIKACIDNRKNLLNTNISSTCPYNTENTVNFGHYRLRSVGAFGAPQQISTGLRVGFVTAATSLNGGYPNFARCMAVSWTGTLLYTFSAALAPPPDGILPRAKFTILWGHVEDILQLNKFFSDCRYVPQL